MELLIESTNKVSRIEGVPVRLWKGTTPAGVEVHVFIHRIAVPISVPAEVREAFAKELQEQLPPGQFFHLRDIL